MGDADDPDASHIKLHQINAFSQGSLVKTSYQAKGGSTAVIVSSATTHLQTTSTQVTRISTLPIQTGPAASYHVPRGAAAVANMAAPRSSVATPVLRGSPLPLSIGTRAVIPTAVQAPRQTAKIPAHHLAPIRGRGVTVASKQQQVVSGRLLAPTLVAARPPPSTIITSNVLNKPVMLSSSSVVRSVIPSQTTGTVKHYHQTDQSTSTTKIYQHQIDQSTTMTKLYQSDQSTSTAAKLYQPVDQSTTKLYHHGDQSTSVQAKIYPTAEQPQGQQPIYLHHKSHMVGGGMYVGGGTNSGGVLVASGLSQAHSAVVVPHGAVAGQHSTAVMAQHVAVATPQQHSAATTTVLQAHTMAPQHAPSVQHSGAVQPHPTLVQQHGGVVHQTGVGHSGVHQTSHATVHQTTVQQPTHGNIPQPHSAIQPISQAPYIEISRQMVRPINPPSQQQSASATSSAIHHQSTVSQVMRLNPVVVVEAGRPQSFQGLLSSNSSGSSSESATLTALPGVSQAIVQPLNQGMPMSSNQPVSSSIHPNVPVAQQVSMNTSMNQMAAQPITPLAIPPQTLAVGPLTVSSIPQSLSTAVAQSLTPKQNTSPRPSILRKRDPDSWSSGLKAQRNLVPVLSGLSVMSPLSASSSNLSVGLGSSSALSVASSFLQTPPVNTLSLSSSLPVEDDAPPGSGGSSTLSAASSPDTTAIEQSSPAGTITAAITPASSPRKKPRKQQLPHNPPPSTRPSPFSDEDMQFLSDKPHSDTKADVWGAEEERRKRMCLLKSYRQGWKPTQNHFMRYCDVRSKEDKKPTLTELANQKNALQVINGWKIYHLLAQIEDMVNTETEYCGLFNSLLSTMEEKQQKIRNKNPDKKTDELLNRLNERIKANVQRCKVVNDHMNEARVQCLKLVEHKSHVADLINRFANKRPIKKRERP